MLDQTKLRPILSFSSRHGNPVEGLREGVSYLVFCIVIKDYEESEVRLLVMGEKLLNRS